MTPTNSPYDSDSDATAELLRQALSAEAAEVQPSRDALRSIQQRTGAASAPSADSSGRARRFRAGSTRTNLGGRRPSWMLGALGAAAATAAVITAVVVIGDQGAGPSRTPAAGPGTTAGQTDTTTEPTIDSPTATTEPSATNAPAGERLTIYYVGPTPRDRDASPRLYAEPHTVPSSGDSPAVGTVRAFLAVHEFLTSAPLDPDYSSGWPAGVSVTGISQVGGTTTVDLAGDANVERSAGASGAEDEMAVQALVATAGVEGPVEFTYNDEPVSAILGVDVPVTVKADEEVRALISIDNLVEGQKVSNPVTVKVSGNVFEGQINWELLDAKGTKVDDGLALTSMGVWTQDEIKLGNLEPGTYTIRCLEYSPEDGSPGNVDDKTFTVR